jgi:hypothetical protein
VVSIRGFEIDVTAVNFFYDGSLLELHSSSLRHRRLSW